MTAPAASPASELGDAAAATDPAITDVSPAANESAADDPGPVESDPVSSNDQEEFGRIVVLAEEPVLADVLAVGVPVVASSATAPDVGLQGIDGDTSGIEIFDYLNTSLEELAALQPDEIIVWQFLVDQIGTEQLEGLGSELLIIPDGTTSRERVEMFGEHFDRSAEADDLLDQLDAAYAAGSEQVSPDCSASVAAIYPGPSPAVFVEPIWTAPLVVDGLGCDLVPSDDEIDADANGRVYLSLEQLEVIAGPELILLQSDTIIGDSEALETMENNPIWAQLPAVASGDVTVVDRLGYPGVVGEIRMIDDLLPVLGG
ncbi:MAG: ABC transporter substrate-binding protein [Ilumatobacter sp.]